MTLRKAKNSLTILLGITIIASVGIVSSANISFAAHDWYTPSWNTPTHTFQCLSSLYTLGDLTVSECTDFGLATDYWDDVTDSDWNLYYSSSGEVELSGANLGTGSTIALTTLTNNWGTITDAKIEFNNQKSFTDASVTSLSSYDWQSVSVHETGHLLNLGEEWLNTDSPMYWDLGYDEVRRALEPHDIAAIQGKY